MRNAQLYRVPVWAGILIFFACGVSAWLKTRGFTPVVPPPLPAQAHVFERTEPAFPAHRYQKLLAGGLFFAETKSTESFHTKLVLWGVISGVTAVVGTNPGSNIDTVLVKVGDEIGGERIVAIGKGYIIVKNPSGEGVIALGQ